MAIVLLFASLASPAHHAGARTMRPIDLGLASLTVGPDGNLWFTETKANRIGRITPSGVVIAQYTIPTSDAAPMAIVPGPDHALWFTEQRANKIGRIDTEGRIREYPIPTRAGAPWGIAAGSDGNLWFVESGASKIARITVAGAIREFPTPVKQRLLREIAAGRGGDLWFTEIARHAVGRITVSGVFGPSLALPKGGYLGPVGIAMGPDAGIWFTGLGPLVGTLMPSGHGREFPLTRRASLLVAGEITAGSDGNMWFTEFGESRIGRITPGGRVTEFVVPGRQWDSYFGIVSGPDHALWFTDVCRNRIGRMSTAGKATTFPVPGATLALHASCPSI